MAQPDAPIFPFGAGSAGGVRGSIEVTKRFDLSQKCAKPSKQEVYRTSQTDSEESEPQDVKGAQDAHPSRFSINGGRNTRFSGSKRYSAWIRPVKRGVAVKPT